MLEAETTGLEALRRQIGLPHKIIVTLELRMDAIDTACMIETTDEELRTYITHAFLKILKPHQAEPCLSRVQVLDVELPKRKRR